MTPTVRVTCMNYECEVYNQEVLLPPDKAGFGEAWCPKCSHNAKVRVSHLSVEAGSTEAFYKQIMQMVRELQLLSRMHAAGVSNHADSARLNELNGILDGLQCSFCGQEVLSHAEARADDQSLSQAHKDPLFLQDELPSTKGTKGDSE